MNSEEYLRRLVDGWPPFTADQRQRLRVLLKPAPRSQKTARPTAA